MKKIVLIVSAFLMLSTSSFAQNNVQININHKLGDADFAMETAAQNNIDNDFETNRLEYYISEISIIHDGGTETAIDDFWVLVNASEATQIELGDHNINSVEMVKLHIGVDPDHNYLDPATWPTAHPLAPKSPSMHWGWAAGYRFIAYEGNGGSSLNQLFELHCLGGANYFTTEIPVTTQMSNNEVVINLDADYTRGLEDVNVNSGLIVHGDNAEAQQVLENFRDYVFTEASSTNSTVDFSEVSKFDVFPNPASGNATITLEASQDLNYQVSVTDILGKQIMLIDAVNSNSTVDVQLENAGFYFVNLIKEGQAVITKKLISK